MSPERIALLRELRDEMAAAAAAALVVYSDKRRAWLGGRTDTHDCFFSSQTRVLDAYGDYLYISDPDEVARFPGTAACG
jgi:hypothetical protein